MAYLLIRKSIKISIILSFYLLGIISIFDKTQGKFKDIFQDVNMRNQDDPDARIFENISIRKDVKLIMIVTSIRTGSTFLGEIISTVPNAYYHYEPLIYRFLKRNLFDKNNSSLRRDALDDLQKFTDCDFHRLKEKIGDEILGFRWKMNQRLSGFCHKKDPEMALNNFIDWIKVEKNLSSFDLQIAGETFKKFLEEKKELKNKCKDLDFLKRKCNSYPIQVIKTVRLPLDLSKPFLETNPKNHIIHLIRDPRANFVSRKKFGCFPSGCLNMTLVCEKNEQNFESFLELKKKFPNQMHLIKYEDLISDPYDISMSLFKKIGLDWTPVIEKYLDNHTKVDRGEGLLNTFKNSSAKVDSWKKEIIYNEYEMVEQVCKTVLELYTPTIIK